MFAWQGKLLHRSNRRRIFVAGPLFAACAVPSPAQEPTLRVDVRLVRLNASVLQPDGRPVSGLTKDRFRVFEENREQQVSVFLAGEASAHVAMLMDTSSSTRSHLDHLKRAAKQFVQRFEPQDYLALYEVSDAVVRVQGFTTDHEAVSKKVGQMKAGRLDPTATTILYDALATIEDDFPPGAERRAILVFSDAVDQGSAIFLEEMATKLLRGSSTVYVVAPERKTLQRAAARIVLGTPAGSQSRRLWSVPSKGRVWVIYLDESANDTASIAVRRQAARRLLALLAPKTRVWLLRFRDGKFRLLGAKRLLEKQEKPKPFSVEEAIQLVDEPEEKEKAEADEDSKQQDGRRIRINMRGDREAYVTGGSMALIYKLLPLYGQLPRIAERVLLPDAFADGAALDAALTTMIKDPVKYVEILVGIFERGLLQMRDDLTAVVEQTGGELLEFHRPADLEEKYDRVAQRIKASYTLGYYTQARRGRLPLRVQVNAPGFEVRSRRVVVIGP